MKIKCITPYLASDALSIDKIYEVLGENNIAYQIIANDNQEWWLPKFRFEEVKEGMDFHTKYSIGDKLYCLKFEYFKIEIPCKQCNETGHILYHNKVTGCPVCKGEKKIYYDTISKLIPCLVTVQRMRIDVFINEKNTDTYTVVAENKSFYDLREEDLFLSELEAQLECDKRNNKK